MNSKRRFTVADRCMKSNLGDAPVLHWPHGLMPLMLAKQIKHGLPHEVKQKMPNTGKEIMNS